jgi:hypothetical protein
MIKRLVVLSILLSGLAWADAQDVVIKSRLDKQSSASLIQRARTFLMNNNFGDPYNQSFEKTIIVDINRVLAELPPGTRTWIKDWQEILNLRVFESSYKLVFENFGYSINHFNSELKPGQSGQNRIEFVTINSVQGLKLTADKIAFQIELKRTHNGEPIKIEVGLLGTSFIIRPELVVEMPMGWRTALIPNSMEVSLHTIDLSRVFTEVSKHPELVDFNVEDISIPDVSVRVGNREVKLDKEKIKKFVASREDELKIAIINMLETRVGDKFSNIIKDTPQEIFLPRGYEVKGDITPVFRIKSMDASTTTRILEAKVDGHFCAGSPCLGNRVTAKERRQIEIGTFSESMREIDLLFNQKRANVAVSISEHYINQLVTAAVQTGLLELGSKDFSLGSEKAFILAEVKGEGFNLYLDIIYKLSGRQRVLVGRSELHFPVRLSIGLKIISQDGFPHLQIKILGVKTDRELLLKGLPQYGLKTNVNTVRFQNKVIEGIMVDVALFDQKVFLDLELKEFKDTYLEELDFFSDGLGRANAVLFINDQKK